MKKDWLWDRKINIYKAKQILKNPKHKEFILLASLLFARENEPKEVFKEYITPLLFCKNWNIIKKEMRKNRWNEPRIIFWGAIYEKLIEKYRKQGMSFRKEVPSVKSEICKIVGSELRNARKKQGLSQNELAKKIGVSQQLISRIEKGKENISLITLKNVSDALGRRVELDLLEK